MSTTLDPDVRYLADRFLKSSEDAMNAFRSMNFDLEHIRTRDAACLDSPALQAARVMLEKKYKEFEQLLGSEGLNSGPRGSTSTKAVTIPAPAVAPSKRKAKAPPAKVEVQNLAPTPIKPKTMAVDQKKLPEKSSLGTKDAPMLIDDDDAPSQDHPLDEPSPQKRMKLETSVPVAGLIVKKEEETDLKIMASSTQLPQPTNPSEPSQPASDRAFTDTIIVDDSGTASANTSATTTTTIKTPSSRLQEHVDLRRSLSPIQSLSTITPTPLLKPHKPAPASNAQVSIGANNAVRPSRLAVIDISGIQMDTVASSYPRTKQPTLAIRSNNKNGLRTLPLQMSRNPWKSKTLSGGPSRSANGTGNNAAASGLSGILPTKAQLHVSLQPKTPALITAASADLSSNTETGGGTKMPVRGRFASRRRPAPDLSQTSCNPRVPDKTPEVSSSSEDEEDLALVRRKSLRNTKSGRRIRSPVRHGEDGHESEDSADAAALYRKTEKSRLAERHREYLREQRNYYARRVRSRV